MRGEWSPEVGRGDSKHPSLPLARAERKPLDQKKKPAPRHRRENQLKEKPALPLARAERKPLDQKKKPAPPLARAERKPFDQKNKTRPAHRRAIHLTFTGFNKCPKQPLLRRVCVAEPLRVPLDAEAEVRVRLFQCFHNAVLAEGGYF